MKTKIAFGVAVVFTCMTCGDPPLRPHFPEDAVQMPPPGVYSLWWDLTKACSQLTAPTAAVNWYMVPGVNEFAVGEETAAGLWWADSNRIVVAEGFLHNGPLVRHEMLHALGQFTGHPALYFRDRCGGIVSCGGHECLREAGPHPNPPANALKVNPADMLVSVAVSPTVYETTNGGWVVVTVSVTNSRTVPVWVKLSPSATTASAETFAFRLGQSVQDAQVTAASLMAFAAGETKRASFDVQLGALGGISAGSYAVRGVFNGDSTQAVFLTVP